SDFVVSTIGDSPVTLIASLIPAGFKVKLITAFWSMIRTTSGRVSLLNPCSSTVTVYGPGGSAGTRYSPVDSLTADRVRPVSVFFAVTVTPGRTPPVASLRVPLIRAFWARAGWLTSSSVAAATMESIHLRIGLLLWRMCPGRGLASVTACRVPVNSVQRAPGRRRWLVCRTGAASLAHHGGDRHDCVEQRAETEV